MKLLLLDKDLTIARPKSGAEFVQSPEDQELIPGAKEALERYLADGWVPVIISNQGGVEAGYKKLVEAIEEMRCCMELAGIDRAYFCPDFEGEKCWMMLNSESRLDRFKGQKFFGSFEAHEFGYAYEKRLHGSFRKPQPGMLLLAKHMLDSGVPFEQCLMVGDRPENEAAANAAGIPFLSAENWRKVDERN